MARANVISSGAIVEAGYLNSLHSDAGGASSLKAIQLLGSYSLANNPASGDTLTFDINGTNVVVRIETSPSAANDVARGTTALLTWANVIAFLENPELTTATQQAGSGTTQLLLSYCWFQLVGTTLFVGSMNRTASAPLTSFSGSTTTSGNSYTANTMALYVLPGVVWVAGTEVYYAGGITPTVTAPSSHPRIDVLTVDNTGTLAWTTGTENASPVTPTYPANKVPICEVMNVTGETKIFDKDNQTSGQAYIQYDVRPMIGTSFNPASISASMIPSADGSYNLGSGSFEWGSVYAKNGIFVAGVGVAIAKFGGLGSDGALTQTSGTTTLSVSGAFFYVKNYSSISLTGTANLTISGQSANGTILVLKSQGNIVLTSSATNVIDLTGLGAAGGASIGAAGNPSVSSFGTYTTAAAGGASGTGGSSTQGPQAGGIAGFADIGTMINVGKMIPLLCGGGGGEGGQPATGFGGTVYGGGGGGGGGTGIVLYNTLTANTGTWNIAGANGCASAASSSVICPGGNGGGALYIECGGAWDFTGNISLAGTHGGNGTGGGAGGNGVTGGSGKGGQSDTNSNTGACGGGGGSGAMNAANGNSGSGGGGGASGTYYVAQNFIFA